MPHRKSRHHAAIPFLTPLKIRPAYALRSALREGYGKPDLRADLMAGAVVGVVALPLSMALAVASGVAPQHGIYTAIIGGFVIALLGGSRVQVSGPTAAFVVILAPIAVKFGLGGLALATVMAGAILVLMGLARLGRLIQFIPYPVTTGFTSGIAVVIALLQLKDFLGLSIAQMPHETPARVGVIAGALPTTHGPALAIGLFTLAILILWPRVTHKVPAPLVALTAAAVAAYVAHRLFPGFTVDTIASRFHEQGGIPRQPPLPVLPWNLPGPDGQPVGLGFGLLRALGPSAFSIAMLGAIESLLSAVVADGMTGKSHDPDTELIAQGAGNLLAPFFGGIAATGAIARTATNIRYGGRSPIAAMAHALFILAAVLVLAPLLGYLPMAALAALLMLVAWNMSEAKHVIHHTRVAPRSDVIVLFVCMALTIVFDMTISVPAGVVLAALLFMRRMAEVSDVKLIDSHALDVGDPLPADVLVYEIAGPMFFGAAHKAMSALKQVEGGVRVVVLDMRSVGMMDATGLVNLESAMQHLHKHGVMVVLGGVRAQPMKVLARAEWEDEAGKLAIRGTFEEAVALARAA